METSISLPKSNVKALRQTAQKTGWFENLTRNLAPSYFGLIALTISVGSCIGGIAAMYIMQDHAPVWQLGLIMFTAMANNVAAIGQTPVKWVLGTFVLVCISSAAMIGLHL